MQKVRWDVRAKTLRTLVVVVGVLVTTVPLVVAPPSAEAAGRGRRVTNSAPRTEVVAPRGTVRGPVVVRGRARDDRAVTKVKLTVKDRVTGRYWNPRRGRWQAKWLWFDTNLARPRARTTDWKFRFDPHATSGSGRYQVAAVAWDDQGRRDPGIARRRFSTPTTPPVDEPGPTPDVPQPGDPGPGGRTLVWSDEFEGSTLDPTHWKSFSGLYNTPYCVQDYTSRSRNVRVEDGRLVLQAHREPSNGQDYTSGMVVSNDVRQPATSRHRGNTAWTHGRFEMRARVPDSAGMWAAFWMRPADGVYGGWPRSGEIDILEYAGPNTSSWSGRRYVHDLHWWSETARNHNGSAPKSTPVTAAWLDQFHTFAVEWSPAGFRWFVDGVQTHRVDGGWSAPGGGPGAPFDQRFFITLNLQVGGWAGAVDDAALPGTFEIDWVRVYQ